MCRAPVTRCNRTLGLFGVADADVPFLTRSPRTCVTGKGLNGVGAGGYDRYVTGSYAVSVRATTSPSLTTRSRIPTGAGSQTIAVEFQMNIPTVGGDRFPMSGMKMPEPNEPLYHVHEIHG